MNLELHESFLFVSMLGLAQENFLAWTDKEDREAQIVAGEHSGQFPPAKATSFVNFTLCYLQPQSGRSAVKLCGANLNLSFLR